MDDRIRLAVTPEADIRVVASNPLGSLDWQLDGFLSGLNLGVLDALDSIKAPTVHPLGSLDWQLDGFLSGLNFGVLDALDSIKAPTVHPLGSLDWQLDGFLSGLNPLGRGVGRGVGLDSIKAPTVHPLGSLDWQLDGFLSGLNLGVLDALDSIKAPTVHPLGSLDWQLDGFLSGLNLGVLDALDSIKAPTVHPLGSLDWPPQGLLSGLNLGVLDALDDTKAVTSRLLGDPDRPPFLAIPNPAPVCPKRQRSVHRFGEPETPLDVCHHHDILDSFDNQITFTGLVRCTRELFAGEHYSLAVEKAFVYVENLVKERSGVSGKYGSSLMKTVFSVQNPFIKLNAGVTDSDRDEQLGYMEVFAGAMTGIRNPRAHAHDWIDEPKEALELLVFANHLVRKIMIAISSRNPR